MKSWHVNTQNLQSLYNDLKLVANQVPEQPTSADVAKDGFLIDQVLSQDDMTLAITKKTINRTALFFLEETTSGETIKHTSLHDLSLFYNGLIWLDLQDGAFDGVLSSIDEFTDIPIIEDPVVALVEQYRAGIFSVEMNTRSGSGWGGTAWIINREELPDGKYKYDLISNAHVLDNTYSEEMESFVWNNDHSQKYKIDVIGVDHTTDVGLATLITDEDLPVLKLATEVPSSGSYISALGNQEGRGIVYTAG